MIDRYTRPEMGHIFSLENKYRIWQEIEVPHLLPGEQVPHLAGDRGPGLRGARRDGQDRHHARGGRLDPRARRLQQGRGRRHRGRDQPRRHRLPHQHGRVHRPRRPRGRAQAVALGPLWHDVLRPRRHGPLLPARPGHRHPHRGLPPSAAPSRSATPSAWAAPTASTPSP